MSTDRIEKQILLKAPLAESGARYPILRSLGAWFGMRFNGPFAPGARMTGAIVPTTVNAEVASAQKRYEGILSRSRLKQLEPERLFSFRWHPGAVDPDDRLFP